ncbi:MAG TPA: YDG domain-containing protein, partial [Chlorobaculum sp.]|nr:YDG domain-containing protein [Chlorobaculum sp.]
NDPTKTYNGNDAATLTSSNYSLGGLVGAENFTVGKATGSYNSANVLEADTVSTTLASGDFTATGSTLSSNYVLPTTASGAGHITAKTVELSATKTYNGDTSLAGAVTITTGVGTETLSYSNATSLSKDVVDNATNRINTITLADGINGELASNYQLPTLDHANAAVNINARTLTASIIGDPTKTYNGYTDATLANSNYSLSGLVSGENFTVTKTQGTYNSKDVLTAEMVTTTLANEDFAAGAGTLSSNYVLPATAGGAGHITAKAMTVTANNDTKTYNGQAYYGGNGVVWIGFVAGENPADLGGVISYIGTSQGAVNAGTYVITPVGNTSTNYALQFIDGRLTISGAQNPAAPPVEQLPVNLNPQVPNVNVVTVSAPSSTVTTTDAANNTLFSTPEGLVVKLISEPVADTCGFIGVSVPEDLARPGVAFSFLLPEEVRRAAADIASVPNLPQGAAERVNLEDGSPLPAWLKYDRQAKAFTASDVPQGGLPLKVVVTIGDQSWSVVIAKHSSE